MRLIAQGVLTPRDHLEGDEHSLLVRPIPADMESGGDSSEVEVVEAAGAMVSCVPPVGGFPWQLGLVVPYEKQRNKQGKWCWRVQCKECGWSPKGWTTSARVAYHFEKTADRGVVICGVSDELLQSRHSDFMQRIYQAKRSRPFN